MTSNDINDMMLYGERINIEYKIVEFALNI